MQKKLFLVVGFLAVLWFVFFNSPVVNAQTVEEIRAQITELLSRIAQLQQQLAQIQRPTPSWCYDFNSNIKWKDKGKNVAALHTALEKGGFTVSSDERADNYFYVTTLEAAMDFQRKYKSDISKHAGYEIDVTGFIGKGTRKKLNDLYGCGITQPIPIPVPLRMTLSISPTNLIMGNTYTFTGTLKGAAPNSDVGLYIQKPDGGLQENYRYIGATDSNGYLSVITSQRIVGGQSGVYNVWALTAKDNKQSNVVEFNVTSPSPTPAPSITVLSPNGGEKWEFGKTYNIRWNHNLAGNFHASIFLHKGTEFYGKIASGILNAQNLTSYEWRVGVVNVAGGTEVGIAPEGNDYRIAVQYFDNGGPVVHDMSDNYFSIVEATPDPTAISFKIDPSDPHWVSATGSSYKDEGDNWYVNGYPQGAVMTTVVNAGKLNPASQYYLNWNFNGEGWWLMGIYASLDNKNWTNLYYGCAWETNQYCPADADGDKQILIPKKFNGNLFLKFEAADGNYSGELIRLNKKASISTSKSSVFKTLCPIKTSEGTYYWSDADGCVLSPTSSATSTAM